MSYLYEIECQCLAGASTSQDSPIKLDAFLTAEPAVLYASVETSSRLRSPEKNITVSLDFTVVEETGPFYEINIQHPEIQVGRFLEIDSVSYEITEILEDVVTIYSLSGPTELEDGIAYISFIQSDAWSEGGEFDLELPEATYQRAHESDLESSSDINDHLSADIGFFLEIVSAVGEIEDGLTVDYSVSQRAESFTEISTDILDKFHGDFPEYFKLLNYDNTQKLFPSGDITYSDFISSNDTTEDLYSFIEEGIFIGDYTTHLGYSERITDDINSYITPNTNHTEGTFTYKAYLDAFTVKPSDTRLLIRLSAPLNNLESRIPPRYTIKDIKFEDPSGNLIAQYEDLVFFGDASDDQGDNKFKNFTTYSLEPKLNVVAEKYQWQDGYPDISQKNGYTITLTILAEALDDAFDEGFTTGFAEIDASGYLFPELLPTNSVRISAIEIWNSGYPGIGPSPEDYLSCVVMPPEKGKRLERKIRPTLIPRYEFDTTIFPESGNLLWTDNEGLYTNIDECDNKKLISKITDGKDETFITTHDVINDSGKLILKFSTGGSDVSEVTPGAFNVAFDQSVEDIWTSPTFSDGRFHPSGAFNTENTRSLDQVDNIFFGLDSISLSVTAKKSPDARDFFLDVVGYSDDCLLRVTNAVDGFLQHPSGTDYFTSPVSSGFGAIDDLGIDGEAISDKASYFETTVSNDHYELTTHPLVDSEEFRTYELPLEIVQKQPELGPANDYKWSTFLESLYLDIFPLPSGACISDIHLIVRYKPQNALGFNTLGGDIGRIQEGRSEGAFFTQAMGPTDDFLNTGSGYQPLSRIENIPHKFKTPNTLKTNYSRRWRGVHGLVYGPYNVNEFGFGFENPELDTPLIDCLIDFSKHDSNVYSSRGTPISESVSLDLSSSPLELYQNIGLRFKNDSMFSTLLPGYTSDYMTADWTALSNGGSNFQNHELYGQIFDGYDNVLRLSKSDQLRFNGIDASSGIVLYSRFIPDANVVASDFEFSRIMSVNQGPSDLSLQVGFLNGYLFASGANAAGANRLISDTVPYSGYQYPLSVVVTYNEKYDQKLRLYTDNELHKGAFTNLRAESDEIELTNLIKGVSFGGLGDSQSLPMLLAEIGYTTPFTGSGSHIVLSNPDRNLKEISAAEFFDNQRMKFFDPEEPYTNDTYKFWDYVNEDSYNDWYIGAYRNPEFSAAFDTLTKRTNRDLIRFYIENDGVAYEDRADLTFPENIDSGVSYHSQVENDFIRFHLSDTVETFNSIHPRITKSLPQGYAFKDKALVVDTILTNKTSGNIQWDRCTSGPKLIVSLYTKNQEPYWKPDNYGLVNRSIHYIEHCPSSIIKIESSFDYNDLCDKSEEWAFFPPEQTIKDFGERLFSDDVDDMFLQYDIVYPSSDGYMSDLKIHTAHVRAKHALITPKSTNENLKLAVSGILGYENLDLDLYMFGVSGYASGSLPLCVSGQQPIPVNNDFDLFTSGSLIVLESLPLHTLATDDNSGSLNLYTSGRERTYSSGSLDLNIYGVQSLNTGSSRNQGGGSGGGGGAGQNRPGMSMFLYNEEEIKGSLNQSLNLNLLKPLSQELILESHPAGPNVYASNYVSWNLLRASPLSLVVFNDHLGIGGVSSTAANDLLPLNIVGKQSLGSNFRTSYHPLFIDGTGIRSTDSQIPLYLHSPEISDIRSSESMPLVMYNVHGIGGAGFNWDSYDYGVGIDARDNRYSRLSLDNEIRGVTTVGYGACDSDSPNKAIDAALITDDIVWRPEVCVDGGIYRASSTYTNPDVLKAFDELPGSYSGNYYEIRKYNKLIANESYFVTMTIETGNTEGISQPRDWEEWEYGLCGPEFDPSGCCTEDCDQEINFSGIKLISDFDPDEILEETSRNESAEYGRSVAITENLMAIGAPGLTIYDEYGYAMPSGGAVFLYRRNEDVAGKKAGWDLEKKLTLPSGFIRDFVSSTPGTAIKYPQNSETQFSIPFQQWDIGQEGREFGHSVALSSSGNNETVIVGAPHADWTRTFADLNVSGIPICMAVFTDKFKNDEKIINRVANEARVFDVLYTYFAERWNLPEFNFNPRLDIKILIYHFVSPNAQRTPQFFKKDFLKHTYVDKLSNSGVNPAVTVESVSQEVKSLFLDTFKLSNTPHSGLPPIMGVFVEESPSTKGGADINPVAQNFIDFYKSYIYESGVIDPEYSLPNSGYLNKIDGTAEDWGISCRNLLNQTLATGNLIDNDALRYIASGFSDNANPALGTFQIAPPSGGKVYIFDREGDEINLVQEVKTFIRRPSTMDLNDDELYDDFMNLEYGQDYHDRFGHAVDISKDGKVVAIGSPFTPRPCEVFERVDSENERMYSGIRDWFVHASGRHDYNGLDNTRLDFSANIDRYDELVIESGEPIARKQSYLELNQSDKFFFRTDVSFWGATNTIELYKKIYDYKYTDIPYTGTWGFLVGEFAPTSRLGYSCAVSDSGNIVAFGAPTDSLNEFDDLNVWYGGTTQLGSGNSRWSSTTNAGAVRLFESRKFYPHSGVVEFTRFGNLDRVLNENKEDTLYDSFTDIYGVAPELDFTTKPRSFRRMEFSEKRIPQDAGVAYIITPERDVISQAGGEEILEGIKEWLALGDRTLVLVANDPKFEDGGVYRKSTDIVNTILEKLGSRMVVQAARTEEEALLGCVERNSYNIIEAFQPAYNHTTFDEYSSNISTDPIHALGVADIRMRLKDDEISVFDKDGVQMPCNDPLRPLNPEPQLPLKQNGDLRAQWNSVCSKCGPFGCAEFEYKTNWAMYFDNPNPSQNCDQYPLKGNLDSPYQDPRPILTAAKRTPDEPWFIPASSYIRVTEEPIFDKIIIERNTSRTFLSDTHLEEVAFNIGERLNTTGPSGIFNAFNINTFTNPETLNFRNPILQAKGEIGSPIMVRDGVEKEEVTPESPLVCEEVPFYAGKNSKVIMIASTRPETALNLGNDPKASAGEDDKNPAFYSSIIKKTCEFAGVVYQVGGWTGRESFSDVTSDFDMEYRLESTRSDLYNILVAHNHTVEENFTQSENYANADVLWIADPTGYDEQGVQELIDFLTQDDKTVVVTYNIQPTQYQFDDFGQITDVLSKPFDTIENVEKICDKLSLSMRPAFSNLIGSYVSLSTQDEAPQAIDYNYQIVSGCPNGFEWLSNYKSEYTYIDYLTTYVEDPANTARRNDFEFVPIINGGANKQIIKYNEGITVSKPKYIEQSWFKMNAESSITFPVISDSGYRVFVNYVSETQDDKISAGITMSSNSSDGGEFAFDELGKTAIGSVFQKEFDIDVGVGATELTVSLNAGTTEKIDKDEVFVEPRSVRIVSISGCPLPKITEVTTKRIEKTVIVGFTRKEETIIIPATSGIIPGEFLPISSDREQYLSPNLLDCDTVTTESLIEDGPVVVAEELENFSSFSSGKRRSRIVVISDPTIVQGRCVHYRDNAVGDNQKFIRSLYLPSPQEYKEESEFENPEYFDTGTKFEYVQKIRSPEAGSPAKYYSLTNEPALTRLFGSPGIGPVAGNQALYRSDEDDFAPDDVYRKKNPKWDEVDQERARFVSIIEGDHGVYPRFSGVFQGLGPLTDAQKDLAGVPRFKIGPNGELIEINQIYYPQDQGPDGGISVVQKLLGRDYLDYIDTFSGYAGDLFGYSIDLSKDKLIVGSPFNGFAPGKVWDWLEVSGDPYASGWKVSEYGGAGAAFFFERTGKGKNATSQFLPFEYKDKLKPESANVGVSGGLTADNILNQKNIGTERHADHTDEDFRQTDQFGRSVSVASDMFAIGAPNHDWITEHHHIYDGNSAFLRKSFTDEFAIPQHEYPESSGDAVLNDGAIYTFRHDLVDFGDRSKEVVFAEKLNKQRYKGRFPSEPLDQFGTENDKFGASVAMHRSFRGDSDYTLVGGAINHDYPTSGNHTTGFLKNAGAAFTFDAMLREQPAVIPTEGGYIYARAFGPENGDDLSIIISQPVSGDPQTHQVSGVVFANRYGEIYLEASGFDASMRGFVIHRPFVKSVVGKLINGTEINNSISMVIPGVSISGFEQMPLFLNNMQGGYVYNNVDLYTSGNIDYASGELFLRVSGNRFLESGIMDLFTSGAYVDTSSLNLEVRGK